MAIPRQDALGAEVKKVAHHGVNSRIERARIPVAVAVKVARLEGFYGSFGGG